MGVRSWVKIIGFSIIFTVAIVGHIRSAPGHQIAAGTPRAIWPGRWDLSCEFENPAVNWQLWIGDTYGSVCHWIIESFKLCGDPLLMLLLLGGVIWGAIVGALPGVGATLGIGILLPFTFGMNPVYAIALFMSINVANSFGNSIPAILMGVPGSSSAVLTAIDGYALHKQGKSGLALGVTYFASCLRPVHQHLLLPRDGRTAVGPDVRLPRP